MTYMAVKFNFQQVLLKTLIPTMNTLEDTAVLNTLGYKKNESKKILELLLWTAQSAHKEAQDHP